ncbi:MAG: carotenoid biosynthesis protein [Flavobacteriales bacterium]|nr:carotenoid biosynthesis protein [Flavobacteriales bacterium]
MKINPFVVWILVIIIYAVGLAGFMIPSLKDLFIWLIPVNILFAFAVLLLGESKLNLQFWLYFALCFAFGYFIELAGTRTGVIFGDYQYGDGLGIKVLDVPLMIGVNWFFMAYTSVSFVKKYFSSKIIQTLLAPALMVAYDFFLEPFAMEHDMWSWGGDIIPLQNYVAWYLGGLFLCSVAIWSKFSIKNKNAIFLFFVQFLFFIILYIRREILS